MAISPEKPDFALMAEEKLDLKFEVLSDLGNRVARKFGLVFTLDERLRPLYAKFGIDLPAFNGDDTFELPVPGTFVIAQDGRIVMSYADTDYTRRAEPGASVAALRHLHRAR